MKKGSLQAPSKGLRVWPTIGEANFLINRLIEAITSLHYKQTHIYIYIYIYTHTHTHTHRVAQKMYTHLT